MPYTGAGDPNLPSNVQKLTEPQRDKWVKTWNSSFKNCRDPKIGGAGTEEHCEQLAFRIANGTIKKEIEEVETKVEDKVAEDTRNEGEKYYDMRSDSPVVPVAVVEQVEPYIPFGGAQSFEEVDEWEKANEQRREVNRTLYAAQDIMENIMKDEDLENKPDKLQKVVDGLRERISSVLNKVAKAVSPNEEGEKQVTKTEDGIKFKASDYAVVPDPEKPNTWKLRLAEKSSGDFTVKQVAMAITAMQPGGFRGERVELGPGDKAQAVKRITAAINKIDATDDQKENLRKRLSRVKDIPSFQIVKDKKGNLRWLGIPSNKWRDRDNPPQIIEEKAHLEFIEYLDRTKDFPVLLGWHTPGTRLGVADFADYNNGFLVMGGPIDKDKYTEAERLAAKCQSEEIGMSHGFVYTYSDREKEIIGKYRAWEVSHLPIGKAANVWTSIDVLKKEVKEMSFNPEKRNHLVGIYGEDTIAAIERKTEDLSKDLLSVEAEFKDMSEFPAPDTDKIVGDTAKAIVESESFKGLVEALSTLTEGIKELKETSIPDIVKRVEAVEIIAKDAEVKATKSVDEIIAEAVKSRSSSFQASKEGDPLSDKDKEKEQESKVETPIDKNMVAGLLGPQT